MQFGVTNDSLSTLDTFIVLAVQFRPECGLPQLIRTAHLSP